MSFILSHAPASCHASEPPQSAASPLSHTFTVSNPAVTTMSNFSKNFYCTKPPSRKLIWQTRLLPSFTPNAVIPTGCTTVSLCALRASEPHQSGSLCALLSKNWKYVPQSFPARHSRISKFLSEQWHSNPRLSSFCVCSGCFFLQALTRQQC